MNNSAVTMIFDNLNQIIPNISVAPKNIVNNSIVIVANQNIHQLSYGGHLAIGIILTLSSSIGILVNGSVIFTFIRNVTLRTQTNWLILSLVISDFCMSFLGTPMVAVSSFYQKWVFGTSGCAYYACLMSFTGYMSIVLLTAISISRYIVTVRREWTHCLTYNVAICTIAIGVLYSLFWSLVPLVGWSSYGHEAANTSCSAQWNRKDPLHFSYSVAVMVFNLAIPFAIIIFCYMAIITKIRHDCLQRRYRLTRQCWNRRSHMEKTITFTIILMIGAFSLSWFPYAIVCLWSILQSSEDIIPVGLAVIPAVIAKVSVVWNPLIYIARTEQFRCAMVDTFPCLRVVSNIVWDNNNFAIEDIEIPANNENRMTVVKYSNQFSLGNDILEFKLEQPGPPKVEVKRKNQNDLKSPNCSQNNGGMSFCSQSNISAEQNNDAISQSIENCNKDRDIQSE